MTFAEYVAEVKRISPRSDRGREYKKSLLTMLNHKHLGKCMEDTYDKNFALQLATEQSMKPLTEIFTYGKVGVVDGGNTILPFMKHTMMQFQNHVHSGEEDAVRIALAAMEVMSDENALALICEILDSNILLREAVRLVINMKVHDFNSKKLIMIPYNG
jgi:hypothetical protein